MITSPNPEFARPAREDDWLIAPASRFAWLTRQVILAILLILGFGAVKLPFETHLTHENRAASFGKTQFNLALRDRLSQLSFLAAFSGFRTLVADVLWIQAHIEWERTEYGRMNLLLGTVTTLAPRNTTFWELSSWHMAFNASVAAFNDYKEPRVAVRRRRQHEYFMIGKDYLERGIASNPNAYNLYQALGYIYKDKLADHCAAAEAFQKAAGCPRAPSYEKRFAAYELSYCPGKEQEAWRELRGLYDLGEQEHLPTLVTRLKAMEEKLRLPPEQRVYKNP